MSIQTRLFTFGSTTLVVALTAFGITPVARADALPAASTAAAVTIPAPIKKTLPVAVDVKTPYMEQTSCDPRAKPGVTAFNALMKARYKTGGVGTYRPCQGDNSEHYDGRAVDWMLNVKDPRQKAIANSVTAWLSAGGGIMARRFGISYIIWNRRVFKEYRPEAGWTTYTGSVPHTDHIHISFSWDGAMKRTSWWTGRATTVVDLGPCRVYAGQFAPLYKSLRTARCPGNLAKAPVSAYKVAVYGQKSAQIATAQRRLAVPATGQFGSATFAKLVAWQSRARVPITGVLDKATWAKLFKALPAPLVKPAPAKVVAPKRALSPSTTWYTTYKRVVLRQGSRGSSVKFLQRALRIKPDGTFGPGTRKVVVAFQARQRLPRTGVVSRKMWNRLEIRDNPLVAYRLLTLRQGSRGAAVAAVQRKLALKADGVFGARTAATVKVVQGRNHLARTGVVSRWTWVAIEKYRPR